jgi:hypothetical protein
VDYKGLHGTDERIRLDSIPAVRAATIMPSSPSARCLICRGSTAASSERNDNGLPKHSLAVGEPRS